GARPPTRRRSCPETAPAPDRLAAASAEPGRTRRAGHATEDQAAPVPARASKRGSAPGPNLRREHREARAALYLRETKRGPMGRAAGTFVRPERYQTRVVEQRPGIV